MGPRLKIDVSEAELLKRYVIKKARDKEGKQQLVMYIKNKRTHDYLIILLK